MAQIAVIDIGKTNAKLVLIDGETGQTVMSRSMANTVLSGPLYPHYNTDALWEFILAGLAEFATAHHVDGISITTHGATAAIMAGADLAMPVLDYEHSGPDNLGADYAAARPGFGQTYSPRLPMGLNLGAQLFWQARNFPGAFARATTILMYPQYWAFRLSGELASEVTSLGTHTDLWNVREGRYSDLVAQQGWSDLFPPVQPAASVLGTIFPDIAARTGLDPATPVACGIHDSNASLLPWLTRFEPSFSVVSSGTWTINMSVGGEPDGLDASRDCLANVDALGRPVPTARFMGGREFEILAGKNPPILSEADIQDVIARDIMAVPTFTPGVGPYPLSLGRWSQSVDRLSAIERSAAATLYVALMTQTCLSLSGLGDRIIVEGPLAQNTLYCRLLSALAERPVHASADATGTALGAAMLFDDVRPEIELSAVVTPFVAEGLADYAANWMQAVNGN